MHRPPLALYSPGKGGCVSASRLEFNDAREFKAHRESVYRELKAPLTTCEPAKSSRVPANFTTLRSSRHAIASN